MATTPDPTQGVPVPAGGSTSAAVQQPIGVPYYITDPSTGQPAVGPDGRPLRWGAAGSQPTELQSTGIGGTRSSGTQATSTYQLPRYFDGDQWLPAQLPPDKLAALQRKMVAAGLLKTGEAQLGVWDQSSMTAYMRLLAFANASGLDVASALDRWDQAHTADPNAGRAPLQVRTTNPDDLKLAFRKAVIDTLGQGWDQAKIDQMVNAYQGIETSTQTQRYNQADTGGVVPDAPSAQTFAETQARQADPLLAQEHDVIKPGGPLDAFKAMLGGWQ